jgi:hypothetical protein
MAADEAAICFDCQMKTTGYARGSKKAEADDEK